MSSSLSLPRYRVIRQLSPTLYGSIFLCEDTAQASSGPVVLKQVDLLRAMTLLNDPPPSAQQKADDPRQEKAISTLLRRAGGHPNLVAYHDDFIVESKLYFVLEYCSDGDLYEYMNQRGKQSLEPLDALGVALQVTSAFAFLHANDIAHRDLSLENVFLDRGVCKLGDFGLATHTTEVCNERVGKAYYMAPEVVAGVEYDPKPADMWSLGILLFVLLTGSPLVPVAAKEEAAFEALRKIGVRSVIDTWGLTDALPDSAIDLLADLLQIDPGARITAEQALRHAAFEEMCAAVAARQQQPATA